MINTTNRNIDKEIEDAFTSLCSENKVHAILLLDDHPILTEELITKCWKPLSSKFNVPIIVPSKTYLSGNNNFGTIAISANLKITGNQIASKVNDVINKKQIAKYHVPVAYACYIKNVLGKITTSKMTYGKIPPFSKQKSLELVEVIEDIDSINNNEEKVDSVAKNSNAEIKVIDTQLSEKVANSKSHIQPYKKVAFKTKTKDKKRITVLKHL